MKRRSKADIRDIVDHLRVFKTLEQAAQISALQHAIFTDPETKKKQEETLRTWRENLQQHISSGAPKDDGSRLTTVIKNGYAFHTMNSYTWVEPVKEGEMNVNNTVVEIEPDVVEIDCGVDHGKPCDFCSGERKKKVHGKKALITKRLDGSRSITIAEGELKGTSTHCPPERLKPHITEKFEEEVVEEPEEELPPVIVVRDFGYGPACGSCHATRGECHGKGCPYTGQDIK